MHKPPVYVEDLQLKGLRILRRRDLPGYSTDSVLLADFANFGARDRIADIGTGTGVLPLLLFGRGKGADFIALEIDGDLAALAHESVVLNGLENVIQVLHVDARTAGPGLDAGTFHGAVCNPPYHRGAGRADKHQDTLTYLDMAGCASRLLRNGGTLCCCAPGEQILALCDALRSKGLEPKRMRMVSSLPDRPPFLCLVEARKGARPGLRIEAPLLLYDAPGHVSQEYRRIYHLEEE